MIEGMEYVANLMDTTQDPREWARRRESQGWPILSVPDHLASSRPFPHVWVTAAAVAGATSHARVTTAFVNNLLRSPVEVAQAALMMQVVSDGRFELGLGAGWLKYEVEAAGLDYPAPADRAGSFIEAAQIVRSVLHTGACQFAGKYHTIDIAGVGPVGENPPLLVGSVGGPRTIREVTPHCDRVELKASSPSTRGGHVDMALMASITDSHLTDLVARVRSVNPDIGIGMFLFCNVGDDEATRNLTAVMGDGLYSRFYGSPTKVAEGIEWLRDQGVSRCQVSPIDDASLDRLAPVLFA